MKSEQGPTSANSAERARGERPREPNTIGASAKYSFTARNLTAYGGLLPVAAMLEKLEFRELVGESVTLESQRMTRAIKSSEFLLGMNLSVERQLARLNARLRERVWPAANVRLKEVTLDTDTTVHKLSEDQLGGRVSYNRKNRGSPSWQPI